MLAFSMKYKLEPDNRNCPKDVLLEDLRETARRLGRETLTKDEYNKHGRFSAATMQKRFGSWNSALTLSGLTVQKRINIPSTEMIHDLQRVAAALGTRTVSTEAYSHIGAFADVTVARAFGSWAKALSAAGLEVSPHWHPKASDDELFSNMANVWEALGRQPKKDDLRPPLSNLSAHTYVRRFGSWRSALETFVAAANDVRDADSGKSVKDSATPFATATFTTSKPRTPRDPGWRLRFLVNRRDRFTCRACGRSPATEAGVTLHVDHIVPWSKGGETTMINLQTLCERCNIGKSDLPMDAT